MPKSYSGWSIIIASSIFLLVIISSIYSLYFGLSLHDEAYYISLPYRFILGDHLFVDEYNIQQTAAIFIYPFIKAFLLFKNSTTGIILFSRYLYFMVSLLVASIIFFAIKRVVSIAAALLIAAIYVIFAPFYIHGLSYNTLAMAFSTIGYFCGFIAVSEYNFEKIKPSDRWLFFAGVSHACMIIAYPTLLVIPPLFLICIIGFLPKMKSMVIYSLGGVLGGAWFLFIILHAGVSNLITGYLYLKSAGAELGGISKITAIFLAYWMMIPHKLLLMFLFVTACYLKIKHSVFIAIIPLLIVVIFFIPFFGWEEYRGSHFLLTSMVFFTPLLFLLISGNVYKQLFYLVWTPAFFAGLITAWTSYNGAINNIVGSIAAALVGTTYLVVICENAPRIVTAKYKNYINVVPAALGLIVVMIMLFILGYNNIYYTYEDLLIPQLHSKLTSGPFKGLYTNEDSLKYYNQFTRDINQVTNNKQRVLFFDCFPAGYLFSNMRPATMTLWLMSPAKNPALDREVALHYYQINKIWPDIIVRMRHVPGFPDDFYLEKKHDPLVALTLKYNAVIKCKDYVIYQRI